MEITKKSFPFFFVLFVSIGTIFPLFSFGFFPIHDDTQVARVSQMAKALSDGHIPVRWVKDLGYGYGYPLFNFYAPLPYYLGGLLNTLGMDALSSTKAMMAIGVVLSGVTMYLFARSFWGELGGIASALLYVYSYYHAVEIYVRGAVGEFWAYSFLPLLFYGLWKVSQERKWKWTIVASLGYAGVILSHNLTALMTTPFVVIATLLYCYIAFRNKNKKRSSISYNLSSIILGLGVSAFYWIPALFELSFTNVASQVGGEADFRDHFVCLSQLWQSPWGFGGSTPGCIDGMSFKAGKLHLILAVLSFPILLKVYKTHKKESLGIVLSIFVFLSALFMAVEISKPVWEMFSPLSFVQYPWRFLIFVAFATSFLGGAILWFLRRNNLLQWGSFSVIVVLLIAFHAKAFEPQTIFPRTSADYLSDENVLWKTSKISDEYMPKDFQKPRYVEDVVRNRVSIGQIVSDKTQELTFFVNQSREERVLVRIAPFPAWRVFIDGEDVAYGKSDEGISFIIPKGRHEVRVAFIETPVEKMSNALSIISVLVLIGGILAHTRVVRTRFSL